MKQKVPGRWVKYGDRWQLEERYVDRGPSRAIPPKRDYAHGREESGKGTGKWNPPKRPLRKITIPSRSKEHPADRDSKSWQRAVSIRLARERKRKKGQQ